MVCRCLCPVRGKNPRSSTHEGRLSANVVRGSCPLAFAEALAQAGQGLAGGLASCCTTPRDCTTRPGDEDHQRLEGQTVVQSQGKPQCNRGILRGVRALD